MRSFDQILNTFLRNMYFVKLSWGACWEDVYRAGASV